jgi:hypothetical protein
MISTKLGERENLMKQEALVRKIGQIVVFVIVLGLVSVLGINLSKPVNVAAVPLNQTLLPLVTNGPAAQLVVLGWNDLGMHCYDFDYSVMSVLPPYNNLRAQVIQRGDPPVVITATVQVEYSIPNNTYSAGKTNFWVYAQKLFGVTLSPNIGLAGKGLAGQMDLVSTHFAADGVPVTEFPDGSALTPNYFQLASIVVKDKVTGKVLAETQATIPVSSEMRCDKCHNTPSTNFRMNILNRHDSEEGTTLAYQAATGNPVLCAGCHADPALGAAGQPGLPSLSAAMHGKHDGIATDCYNCHPGPTTKCLRDVMSVQFGKTCTDCHVGGMGALAQENRTPWVDLPRCANCHAAKYAENTGILYKLSTGHGGLYCESCHNSTHAITPSREANDNYQSIMLQGTAGPVGKCTVCHLTQPTGTVVHP